MLLMPHISKYFVENFRNIGSLDVEPAPGLNAIIGGNGAGKTGFLESLSVLAHGKSFRTHKYASLIRESKQGFTLFATSDMDDGRSGVPVGVQRVRNGNFSIKLDGRKISSSSELARELPLIVINSSSFKLLEGSPRERRGFFDWLVFHVKHDFSSLWRQVTRCYKQRNSLLKRDKIRYSDLEPWDIEIARLCAIIDALRADCFSILLDELRRLLEGLGEQYSFLEDIDMKLKSGWREGDADYLAQLRDNFTRDAAYGYSALGPQKADLVIRSGRLPVDEFLSRGQLKLLICALYITEAKILIREAKKTPIFAIDDLPAELDEVNQRQLGVWLRELDAQVFVTGIEEGFLPNIQPAHHTKVFHVKHGVFEERV